ncbi:formin-binding protein HOF1 Ecym_2308 [Eremothecium cymbalariae DBVPG|uniref:SH3 domain-containing protein n=1 Tax=Eremothecium cymbalariae (strain CBS 270.75 / DBVPG 7215 / KCTC 17166 / NRRL Y-17582) TaxID=931890 RepID=G8JQ48_ERECY|nr:Hypothetical protein Ecym_2308 [Eremothecium cymbalariae DBVPG\
MALNYNYQSNFWDAQEEGVRILLRHVAQGLEVCKNLSVFFEERSKLEKDYSRKMGAIVHHLEKQLKNTPDYGNMQRSLELCKVEQTKVAQSHSKQAEQIYREQYNALKEFVSNGQARYKTLEGKIRQLRMDKVQKRQMHDELLEKLEKAKVELREYQLNQQNLIGGRESMNNQKQLSKWRSIVDELSKKIDVLSQEAKAANKRWLQEWGSLSMELQLLEESRMQMMKTKIQEFAVVGIDAAVHEQISLEKLTTMLAGFTIQQDIYSFAYNHGTGRVKAKDGGTGLNNKTIEASSVDKHTENMRILSSKLPRNRPVSQPPMRTPPDSPTLKDAANDNYSIIVLDEHVQQSQDRESNYLMQSPTGFPTSMEPRMSPTRAPYLQGSSPAKVIEQNGVSYPDDGKPVNVDSNECPPHSSATVKRYSPEQRQPVEVRRIQKDQQLINEEFRDTRAGSSESESYTSNPTDYTQKKVRTSIDSMSTSISSYASSIDDSQRLAKSWNSRNRRKSRDFCRSAEDLSRPSSDPVPIASSQSGSDGSSLRRTRSHRRKSLAADIDGALRALEEEEMKRNQPKSKNLPSSDSDSDGSNSVDRQPRFIPFEKTKTTTFEWPKATSRGQRVIGYAKALYSFTEPNENDILNFQMGDHLLLTEKLNTDWYIGEVHNSNGRQGLIPMNYVKFLS